MNSLVICAERNPYPNFSECCTTLQRKPDSAPVNAKSIMMILAAGLGTGTTVEVSCDGPDEAEALDALVALIDSGFGE